MIVSEKEHLLQRIESALSTIRPHLEVDGGNVELVDVSDDMIVQIRWTGMCESCNMSAMTLRAGISEAIKSKIPEIIRVEAINGINNNSV
jgi:Fe-S cluster biogenesis protein NfuA